MAINSPLALTMRLLVQGELAPAGGIPGAPALTSCAWPRPVRPGDEPGVESKGELRSLLVGVACPTRNGGPDGFEPVFQP